MQDKQEKIIPIKTIVGKRVTIIASFAYLGIIIIALIFFSIRANSSNMEYEELFTFGSVLITLFLNGVLINYY